MEIAIADENFRPSIEIAGFETLIWTTRYNSYGDFKLTLKEDVWFSGLRNQRFLVSSESNKVMMIETVSDPKQVNGKSLVTVSGRSIEAFLATRDNRTHNLAVNPPQIFTGSAGEIARWIVLQYCIDPAVAGVGNVIPKLTVASTLSGPVITLSVDRGNIYDIVKSVCDSANLGFTIFRSEGQLVFYVFRGIDYTDPSNPFAYREYSPNASNLMNTSSLESVANYKNHARVLGNKTGVDVYEPPYNAITLNGYDRRTMVIEASDVGSGPDETDPAKITTVADDQALLRQRGKEALADQNNSYIWMIDGTVPQNAWNETHFSMGDIVIVKGKDNASSKMQIIEEIWSVDKTGTQHTPTFKLLGEN